VGIDNFSNSEIDGIDYAIYQAQRIFRTVNLGIGRVEHYDITSAEARGTDNLGSHGEAVSLIYRATVPNNGLDVFMVSTISDPDAWVGTAPSVPGPCQKGYEPDKSTPFWEPTIGDGIIGGRVDRPSEGVSRTFVHEIGHFLGLKHNHDDGCPDSTSGCNNLMAQTRCANSCGSGVCEAINLTESQGEIIRDHCYVHHGC
jgi:hypothetical protein